jgi:hypothetical protein
MSADYFRPAPAALGRLAIGIRAVTAGHHNEKELLLGDT